MKLQETQETPYGIKPHMERLEGYTYALSYGGGTNSTALLIEIIKRGLPLDYVVFADVGYEYPETYDFINNHFVKFCMDNNVKFCTVSKFTHGKRETILEYFHNSYRVPDQIFRDCTRRHKIEPIHRFYSKQLKTKKIIEYIGIHAGEKQRVKKSKTEWVIKCYPLYEFGINQSQCVNIIREANLPVPPKSGCPNCFAMSKKQYYELYQKHPDLFDTAIEIEENYLENKKQRGLSFYYYNHFRGKAQSLKDLKEEFATVGSLDTFMDEDKQMDAECEGHCMT